MKDLIIVGAGGLGREVLEWIKDINAIEQNWRILGFIDRYGVLDGIECDYEVIGVIEEWEPQENQVFVMAIGDPDKKEKLVTLLKSKGAKFTSVIHPTAIISEFSKVGEGLIVYPYSGISPNVRVGSFVTLNAHSGIGHDAQIGDYCTISSFCDIMGGVDLGHKVFLGSHVSVIPEKKIGEGAFVATGSVVMSNIKAGARVMGYPAAKYL